MFAAILWLILLACLVGLIIIIKKHWLEVLSSRPDDLSISKEAAIKTDLLERRMERKIIVGKKFLEDFFEPLANALSGFFQSSYAKIVTWEEEYRHKILKDSLSDRVKVQQQVDKLLAKANGLKEAGKLLEAEKAYIEVLSLDDKNVPAYRELAEVYWREKDYVHAKDTFEFLLKLNSSDPFVYRSLGGLAWEAGDLSSAKERYSKLVELEKNSAMSYIDLARVYLAMEDNHRAFELATTAATIEPNNPKVLDFLLDVSIIMQDKTAAEKAWKQLNEVNPDNQKLEEFNERIEAIK